MSDDGKIVNIDGSSHNEQIMGDVDPQLALSVLAHDDGVEHFAAIVLRDDGTLTFHSSNGDAAEVNLWIDMFKNGLINGFSDG